jgi:hypothetical protein
MCGQCTSSAIVSSETGMGVADNCQARICEGRLTLQMPSGNTPGMLVWMPIQKTVGWGALGETTHRAAKPEKFD